MREMRWPYAPLHAARTPSTYELLDDGIAGMSRTDKRRCSVLVRPLDRNQHPRSPILVRKIVCYMHMLNTGRGPNRHTFADPNRCGR